MKFTKKPETITQDMVGMEIHTTLAVNSEESNEARVYIILDDVSDEGLELFGIDQDNDMDWTYYNNLTNPRVNK